MEKIRIVVRYIATVLGTKFTKKAGMFTKEENIYARMSMHGKRMTYDYTIFNIVCNIGFGCFYPNKLNKIKQRGNQQLGYYGR